MKFNMAQIFHRLHGTWIDTSCTIFKLGFINAV